MTVTRTDLADGSTITTDHNTGKACRTPSLEQACRRDSDATLWMEVQLSPMIAVPCLEELARRGDPDAVNALKARGLWKEQS